MDLQHLNNIYPTKTARMGLVMQSSYAAPVAKQMIDSGSNNRDLYQDFSQALALKSFKGWNATSVGNTAYAALHSDSQETKDISIQLLQMFAEKYI